MCHISAQSTIVNIMLEATIIQGCKKGDPRCQRAIVDTYASTLLPICIRYCGNRSFAHDALQETFISVFKYIHSFQQDKSFDAWIKKIAVNCSLQVLRKYKPFSFSEDNTLEVLLDTQIPDIYGQLHIEEILFLLQKLPPSLQLVFNLYVMEGFSHDDIAQTLQITNSTSRAHLTKARMRLIELIKAQDHLEEKIAKKISSQQF